MDLVKELSFPIGILSFPAINKLSEHGIMLVASSTRQELADLIGISRESATRVLLKLKEDGIFSLVERMVKIKDQDLLQQISRNG